MPDVGRLHRCSVETPRRAVGRTPVFQAVRVTAGAITVHLPGGVRIEVPAEQPDAVRVVLEELCRWRSTGDGEEGSC